MNGNLFCGGRRFPPSPEGYSSKAMNENVMSLTAIYLKCVSASLNTPSPQPLNIFSLPQLAALWIREIFLQQEKSTGEGRVCTERVAVRGIMIIFHGKSIFHYERKCYGY